MRVSVKNVGATNENPGTGEQKLERKAWRRGGGGCVGAGGVEGKSGVGKETRRDYKSQERVREACNRRAAVGTWPGSLLEQGSLKLGSSGIGREQPWGRLTAARPWLRGSRLKLGLQRRFEALGRFSF